MRRLFRIHIPCYEFEDFSSLIEYGGTPEQICYHRTMNCLEWYIRKAIFYKRIFYLLSMVNLLLPLLSTAIVEKGFRHRDYTLCMYLFIGVLACAFQRPR